MPEKPSFTTKVHVEELKAMGFTLFFVGGGGVQNYNKRVTVALLKTKTKVKFRDFLTLLKNVKDRYYK